jgi:hypothetical protein
VPSKSSGRFATGRICLPNDGSSSSESMSSSHLRLEDMSGHNGCEWSRFRKCIFGNCLSTSEIHSLCTTYHHAHTPYIACFTFERSFKRNPRPTVMDNDAIDEDSIDMETLQAQIDMSMAFAQNLVSSWVKPFRKLPSRSNRDMEAELKEYMRRPPR